jgi:serine/threonine protein kinase
MAAPLESPQMSPIGSPNGPNSPVFRMVEKLYVDPSFNPILKNKNIKTFLEGVGKNTNIKRGRTSSSQLIDVDGKTFLLRITPYTTHLQRMKAIKEITIYEHLKKDPKFIDFISNLLYADAHLASGKKESYFIFAYEPGETLDRYIVKNKGALSNEQIMAIYDYLNQAVDFLGRRGIVHKDIKPDNIYFSTVRNIPLIFDFDTSCIIGIDCNAVEFEGSPKYATPNSKLTRQQEGFSASFKIYKYNTLYDKFSVAKMLEHDLSEMASSEEAKEEIKAYAKSQQIIFLAQNKNKQNIGGMRRNKTRKVRGGSCNIESCQIKQSGGDCRIGVLNPWWGGKNKPSNKIESVLNLSEIFSGGGCGCGVRKEMMELPSGISLGPLTQGLKGGGCPCQAVAPLPIPMGGYRATKRNLKYLKKWKRGESIGFTMRSSLKAKGLIPRANGKKRISTKYKK